MASVKGSEIIKNYLDKATKHIQDKINEQSVFYWNEIGSDLLTPIIEKFTKDAYIFDEKLIHPFDFTESWMLEKKF